MKKHYQKCTYNNVFDCKSSNFWLSYTEFVNVICSSKYMLISRGKIRNMIFLIKHPGGIFYISFITLLIDKRFMIDSIWNCLCLIESISRKLCSIMFRMDVMKKLNSYFPGFDLTNATEIDHHDLGSVALQNHSIPC